MGQTLAKTQYGNAAIKNILISQNSVSILAVEDDEGNERLMLNYAGFSVVAIKAIQEQQQIIETQQTKIETQEARLSALEKEMAEIKAMLKTNMTANSGEK